MAGGQGSTVMLFGAVERLLRLCVLSSDSQPPVSRILALSGEDIPIVYLAPAGDDSVGCRRQCLTAFAAPGAYRLRMDRSMWLHPVSGQVFKVGRTPANGQKQMQSCVAEVHQIRMVSAYQLSDLLRID